jgi:hypothetical protein
LINESEITLIALLVIDYSMGEMFIMLAKAFCCSYGNTIIDEPAIQMQCVKMMLDPKS